MRIYWCHSKGPSQIVSFWLFISPKSFPEVSTDFFFTFNQRLSPWCHLIPVAVVAEFLSLLPKLKSHSIQRLLDNWILLRAALLLSWKKPLSFPPITIITVNNQCNNYPHLTQPSSHIIFFHTVADKKTRQRFAIIAITSLNCPNASLHDQRQLSTPSG